MYLNFFRLMWLTTMGSQIIKSVGNFPIFFSTNVLQFPNILVGCWLEHPSNCIERHLLSRMLVWRWIWKLCLKKCVQMNPKYLKTIRKLYFLKQLRQCLKHFRTFWKIKTSREANKEPDSFCWRSYGKESDVWITLGVFCYLFQRFESIKQPQTSKRSKESYC